MCPQHMTCDNICTQNSKQHFKQFESKCLVKVIKKKLSLYKLISAGSGAPVSSKQYDLEGVQLCRVIRLHGQRQLKACSKSSVKEQHRHTSLFSFTMLTMLTGSVSSEHC